MNRTVWCGRRRGVSRKLAPALGRSLSAVAIAAPILLGGLPALAQPALPVPRPGAGVSVAAASAPIEVAAGAVSVLRYGARCDGKASADDGPAFQAAVNAAPAGGVVAFPGGCFINTTVEIGKPLTLSGEGLGASLFVPSATAFRIRSPNVRLTNFYVLGNRSQSPDNRLFDVPAAAGGLFVDHVRAERLNTIGSIAGGAFYHLTYIAARNIVRAGFVFDGFGNANGNDAFVDQVTYDTDGGFAQPTVAFLWCRDFDALVVGPANDFIHAGQVAALYFNPIARSSGNHMIGAAYFDTTQGAGIAINPEGTAIVNRLFIDGSWFSTDRDGIYLSGKNNIVDVQVRNGKFHHNICAGIRGDNVANAPMPTSFLVQGSVFAGNNEGGGRCADVDFEGGGQVRLKVFNNTFGKYFLWRGVPTANVVLGAAGRGAQVEWNDFSDSAAPAKVVGPGAAAAAIKANEGLEPEAAGRGR